MEYNIKPIETYYNNQYFKSILEARWACFFDICGWKWAYEPFKINKKIPDFIIKGLNNDIIVEVKPEIFIDSSFIKSIENNYRSTKLIILLLSDKPFIIKNNYCKLCDSLEWFEPEYYIDEFYMKSVNDFSSILMNWTGKIFDDTNRKNFIMIPNDTCDYNEILHNWQKAGIATKYNSY
jgi:hypothetical protein